MKISVHDVICYGINGVCRVEEIKICQFGNTPEEYYLLKPIDNQKSVIFVPTGNEKLTAKMTPLLSRAEIENIMETFSEKEDVWIENDRERQEKNKEVLNSCDRMRMARLIRILSSRKEKLSAMGKKLRSVDEAVLAEAKQLLLNEFSYVLGMDSNEISTHIEKKLAAIEPQPIA